MGRTRHGLKVEKAKVSDAPQIRKLVNSFAAHNLMLPRSLSEVYENIRDYFVVREGDRVVGCGALHITWGDLAEIKSVAVHDGWQRKGVGESLVNACIEEARSLDLPVVFCLTYEVAFFEKFGFQLVDPVELPRKIWGECLRCPKYPDCDEKAMMLKLKPVTPQW